MDRQELKTRLVISVDEGNLLEWRSSPEVSSLQLSPSSITIESHRNWFHSRLKLISVLPFVAFELQNQTVAYIRLEKYRTSTSISVLVAPKFRNIGIGRLACSIFLNEYTGGLTVFPIYACIHKDNVASIRLFSSLGFEYISNIDQSFIEMSLSSS